MPTRRAKKFSIELTVKEYEKLLDELDAIRAYDEAKSSGERAIPFHQAVQEIEPTRK